MATTITWGLHASSKPTDTAEAALLLAGQNEEYNGVLRVCNQDTKARTYYVAHCADSGEAQEKEWIAYATEIDAGEAPHEYSLHIGNEEEIRIKVSEADTISFHFSGEKKVVS